MHINGMNGMENTVLTGKNATFFFLQQITNIQPFELWLDLNGIFLKLNTIILKSANYR